MNKRSIFKRIAPLLFLLFLTLVSTGTAFAGDVNPDNGPASDHTGGGSATGLTYDCGLNLNGVVNGQGWGNCTFDDLVAAVNKIINVGTLFALAFTVVVLAYAGFKYMTAGDNPGNIKEANQMFVKVAYGITYILCAWLIVHLVMSALTKPTITGLLPFN